jgi:hypothetical protein
MVMPQMPHVVDSVHVSLLHDTKGRERHGMGIVASGRHVPLT